MIYIHKCLRCEYEWPSRKEKPLRCAKCKTPYWNIPKRKPIIRGGKRDEDE